MHARLQGARLALRVLARSCVFPQPVAAKWYDALLDLITSHGAPISKSRASTARASGYQYKTARFTRCTCNYDYAGTARHKQYHYGFADSDGPVIISEIEQYLRSTCRLDLEAVPDCWVVNSYVADKFVNSHTDEVPGLAKEVGAYGLAPRSAQ